jgi:xylulokinase
LGLAVKTPPWLNYEETVKKGQLYPITRIVKNGLLLNNFPMLFTVDIGTSTFKSALFDFDGNPISFASVPLSTNESGGLKHEAESEEWLGAFESCCAKLGNLDKVLAIVITGNGPSLIPVLGEPGIGNKGLSLPAEPARLWLDRRARDETAEVSALMGGYVDPSFFLPKVLSIKKKEPGLYSRTKLFTGSPEFLAYALDGQARSVFPSRGFDRWFWNDNILKKLELDPEKFPPFISPGDAFGEILPPVAAHFGFVKNIPVISGGPDFFAAILGSGVTKPGQVCDRTGTSEGINLCTDKHIKDERLMSYGHPVEPYWNLSGTISTTGKAIEWCRDLLGLESFEDFFALASKSKPGSGGMFFLPCLAGERSPVRGPSARPLAQGLWRGLSLSCGRAEAARSVLEGIGFAIRDIITVMEEAGAGAGDLRVTGGSAKDKILNQIKSDITGREVLEPVLKECGLLGLAMIGARALEKYVSFEEASSALARVERHYEPNLKMKTLYDELFGEYRESSRMQCANYSES